MPQWGVCVCVMAYCTFSETSFNCSFKTRQPLSWLCRTFNRVNCRLHPWAAFSSVSEVLHCCCCCIGIRRCDISDRGGPKHAPASRHAVGGHLSVSAILRPCSYFILLCLHALSRDIMEVWKKKKEKVPGARLHLAHDIILSHPVDAHWYDWRGGHALARTHKTHKYRSSAINTALGLFNGTAGICDRFIYTTEPIQHSEDMWSLVLLSTGQLTHRAITHKVRSEEGLSFIWR